MTAVPDNASLLPEGWLRRFDGERLAGRAGEAAILATVDAEDWPHLAFLSVGEVFAPDVSRLYFATWARSRSTQNLQRQGKASLFVALGGSVWEARLRVHQCNTGTDDALVVSAGDVVAVREHAAPYASVLGLVSFRLDEAAEAITRWEQQIEMLRKYSESGAGSTTN
jgi:hypothetical protein